MITEINKLEVLTPLFTIFGVILGAFLTFLTSRYLKAKETKLRITGQLIQKKIESHENVLALARANEKYVLH